MEPRGSVLSNLLGLMQLTTYREVHLAVPKVGSLGMNGPEQKARLRASAGKGLWSLY